MSFFGVCVLLSMENIYSEKSPHNIFTQFTVSLAQLQLFHVKQLKNIDSIDLGVVQICYYLNEKKSLIHPPTQSLF